VYVICGCKRKKGARKGRVERMALTHPDERAGRCRCDKEKARKKRENKRERQ